VFGRQASDDEDGGDGGFGEVGGGERGLQSRLGPGSSGSSASFGRGGK
jgi:hypothetical protein